MSRAQITIFIILGIVILAVFISVFYVLSANSQAKLDEQVKKVNQNIMNDDSLQYYITMCVDRSLKDGLLLLGSQGGAIYESQGGLVPDDMVMYANYIGVNLSFAGYYMTQVYYLITLATHAYDTGTGREIPYFPCQCMCQGQLCVSPVECVVGFENPCFYRYASFENATGHSKMTLLPLEGPGSIKASLEAFIVNKTRECVDITNLGILKEGFDAGVIDLVLGNVTANVSFGHDDTSVDVHYPVEVKFKNRVKEAAFLEYAAREPVRLAEIHLLLKKVLREDANQFNRSIYSIFTEKSKILGHYQEMKLTRVAEVTDMTAPLVTGAVRFNDIFVLTDQKSTVDGVAYNFTFLRQNRYPALDYVGSWYHDIDPDTFEGRYDYIVKVGDTIKIDPVGHDLDEDVLTYSYSQWRENYTDHFDYSLAQENNCLQVPANCTFRDSSYPHLPNWTTSDEFAVTKRTAAYRPVPNDVGYHEVNVSVSDGMFDDWQTVRILVIDKPTCRIKTYNIYPGVPNDTASVEDIYILDSQGSQAFFCPPHTRIWKDDEEDTSPWNDFPEDEYLYYGMSQLVYIGEPQPKDWSSVHPPDVYPENMSGAFNNSGGAASYFKEHEVLFNLKNSCDAECVAESDVVVSQCIPWRSNYSSYPFHALSGNAYPLNESVDNPSTGINESSPFYANHTCCLDKGAWRGEWAPASTECFSYNATFCGLPADGTVPPANLVRGTVTRTVTGVDGWAGQNDVFQRDFKVFCSGQSGNSCDGNANDHYTNVLSCGDMNEAVGEIARCTGCASFGEESDGTCKSYSGTTWEYVNGLELKNGSIATNVCNPIKKCSSSTLYKIGSDTNGQLCQATCGGGVCNRPTNCVDCSGSEGYACKGNDYVYVEYGCQSSGIATVDDQCTDDGFPDLVMWSVCSSETTFNQPSYCDGDGPKNRCNYGECCSNVGGTAQCADPCGSAHSDCIRTRTCTVGPDSCGYWGSNHNCGSQGYCDSVTGACLPDMINGGMCDEDAQCVSGSCNNELLYSQVDADHDGIPDSLDYGTTKLCCNTRCVTDTTGCMNNGDTFTVSTGAVYNCTSSAWVRISP